MNLTTRKVVILLVAVFLFAGILTYTFIKWSRSVTMAQRSQAAIAKKAMTLNSYPDSDPQALADLQSKLTDRQTTKDTDNETTIDLKPYVNCKLTDPLADQPGQKDHTFSALPTGVNTYGGVPFNVQGIIQLNGNSIKTGVKLWPLEVPGIAIGRAVKKLYLLHGAFNIVAPKGHYPFAKLVLHYADGSQKELELDGGIHTLRSVDAWIPQEIGTLPSQTELAWVGTNPYLKEKNPSACLHLYRTTLVNPFPDIPVTTIDYLSIMGNPGPFMVGLTIE